MSLLCTHVYICSYSMVTPVSIRGYGVGGQTSLEKSLQLLVGLLCGGATARCHRVQHIASWLAPYYTKQSRRTKNMGFCECFVIFMYVLLMFFLVFI